VGSGQKNEVEVEGGRVWIWSVWSGLRSSLACLAVVAGLLGRLVFALGRIERLTCVGLALA
jgi:hypothetical protein